MKAREAANKLRGHFGWGSDELFECLLNFSDENSHTRIDVALQQILRGEEYREEQELEDEEG